MSELMDMQVPKDAESPLKQYFDNFDVQHFDWRNQDYKMHALQTNPDELGKLLIQDWKWRKDHQQNVVASMEGPQGTGKSRPCSYVGLLLGQIFEFPFTPIDIFFSPDEFDEGFQKAKPCQTLLKDEDPKTRVGLMSHMIDTNITDYEEQSRQLQINLLQAGVELRKHAHFFCFESKHILFDENAYPIAFMSVLKTPRYTDRYDFVWRGMVRFPMVNREFDAGYLKRKNEHLKNLQAKYGNSLDPVAFFAKQIYDKRKDRLLNKTKDSFVKPIKQDLMEFIVAEEIGTRRFTVAGYKLLYAKMQEIIISEFQESNDELYAAIQVRRELEKQQSVQQKEEQNSVQEQNRKEKLEFLKEKLLEEKRKNDIKEKTIALKEKALTELAGLLRQKQDLKGMKTDVRKQLL
jgi:hypothetical protein